MAGEVGVGALQRRVGVAEALLRGQRGRPPGRLLGGLRGGVVVGRPVALGLPGGEQPGDLGRLGPQGRDPAGSSWRRVS